ncbi:MAG: hypothetical protein IJ752_08910 [Alphaproteobacteria bacterium]|nr:hypothetical protein [Alphaproteobacteria bacterium]
MTKLQKIRNICWNTLRVVIFYLLFLWWGFQLGPMLDELFISVPFIVFISVTLFLSLFLCRETGCLIFMSKGRLMAILKNGEIEPTASQIILRLFSWPFLKRVCMFLGLFVLEFYLRLFLIKLFLITIQASLSFWEKVTNVSEGLLYPLMLLAAYVIMELPAWLLFYKLSFKGHSNRSYEYRFGMKLSVLVIIVIGLRLLTSFLTAESSSVAGFFAVVLFALCSFGAWYLMYRRKCCCARSGCPICRVIKGLFRKKETSAADSAIEVLPPENR